jgi:hypothetical protein
MPTFMGFRVSDKPLKGKGTHWKVITADVAKFVFYGTIFFIVVYFLRSVQWSRKGSSDYENIPSLIGGKAPPLDVSPEVLQQAILLIQKNQLEEQLGQVKLKQDALRKGSSNTWSNPEDN